MAGLSASMDPQMFPDPHDESASSIVYEPLSTFQDKENSVNRGPLSTRHGSSDSPSGRRWVDGMVKVAHACNLLVRRNCNLCHVYADRQVEFEQRQETTSTSSRTPAFDAATFSPAERAWQKLHASMEVDIYRQFLFDEESVGMDIMAESSPATNTTTTTTRLDPDKHQPSENLTFTTQTSSEFLL